MDRDMDRDQILQHLRLQDCEPRLLAVTSGGLWHMFVPGLPEFANRDFPERLRLGEPLAVECTGIRAQLRLTETDSGTAVTLRKGERLRVVLESNASTGYQWVVTPVPSASVLAPMGEPFYVTPATDLLGAAGHQVFDFTAVGPGTATLRLAYQRTTTPPEAPAKEWTVTVTVQ